MDGPAGEQRWTALFALSGATALTYEAVWFRRLSLLLGASAPAAALTVAAFMGGLALGGVLARRGWRYAQLELGAAAWAVAMPLLAPLAEVPGAGRWLAGALLLLPPATALGATWGSVVGGLDERAAARLYAANTAGAVAGVLGSTLLAIPLVGVRGTELLAAAAGAAGAVASLGLVQAPVSAPRGRVAAETWVAAGAAGCVALALEVLWLRLAAVGLGATVQATGWVLAVFLAMSAAGAALGGRYPADPRVGLARGLGALGVLALVGGASWAVLPYGLALGWAAGGPEGVIAASAALAAIAMAGAPAASGFAFAAAVRSVGAARAGVLYAVNSTGSMLGALLAAEALPWLGMRGSLAAWSLLAALVGAAVGRSPRWLLAAGVLAVAIPAWDARLYAVGVYLRISDFGDPSPGAVRAFADEGWDLLAYEHGRTGTVAVGRSRTTGNTWLSINGKVDASTGDDMPTQRLSGQLPVRLASRPVEHVLVVGLASGVTAGAVLAEPGVRSLSVVELEPAVVRASRWFDAVNGRPLADPRTSLFVDDARGWLARRGPTFDAIVSEPSNPWITGVSSLFTREYWALLRAHLRPGGVVCQWVQLYGLGTDELRAVLRTFLSVFPDSRLYLTVEGSDVLLIGGSPRDDDALPPLLDAEGLRRAAGDGWLNTDDRPRLEWRAPLWLHYDTGPLNEALLRGAAGG